MPIEVFEAHWRRGFSMPFTKDENNAKLVTDLVQKYGQHVEAL